MEQIGSSNGRTGFAPVGFIWGDHRQAGKRKIGHGTGDRADVERIARRDEDDFNAIALGLSEQEMIVESLSEIATLGARMVPDTDSLRPEAEALCATARWCYARGWVPATSGNFSVRDGGRMLISPSGLDKGVMTTADLLETDLDGRVIQSNRKPSAETALHLVIYRDLPEMGAIVHVHSIWNTLLSAHFASDGYVPLTGYELLKGLAGVTTHEYQARVPIIANSQDYVDLAERLAQALEKFDDAHGVLLSAHGLYTWGKSVAEARRHLEALEFLFEVEGRRLTGGLG